MKYLAPLVLLLALAGCGSSAPTSSPSSSESAVPVVQPCDGLDAAAVAKVLGSGLTVDTGTTDSPRCALLPTHKGDPVFTFNYQWWFSGGLDAAFKTMNIPKGAVEDIEVPGAHAAKLVQQESAKDFRVSGFVENGNLIQLVDGEALAPYSKPRMIAATKLILEQLSKSAPSQG